MALDDRTIDFPVAGGLNDGADELQSNSPLLNDAVDCIFRKDGRVERRKGTLAAAAAAGAFPNSVFGHQGRVFTHSEGGFTARPLASAALGVLMNKSAPPPVSVKIDPAVRPNFNTHDADVACANGLRCTVWANSPAFKSSAAIATVITVRVDDEVSGVTLNTATLTTAVGASSNPRVVVLGGYFFVTAIVGAAQMSYWTFDSTNPAASWSTSTLLYNAGAIERYDICVSQAPGTTAAAFLAIHDSISFTITILKVSSAFVITANASAIGGFVDIKAISCCYCTVTNAVWTVAFFGIAAATQIALYRTTASTNAGFAFTTSAAPTNYPTDFAADALNAQNLIGRWRISVGEESYASGSIVIAWSWGVIRQDDGVAVSAAGTPRFTSFCVQSIQATGAGVLAGGGPATLPGYELVSKPFTVALAGSTGLTVFVVKWATTGADIGLDGDSLQCSALLITYTLTGTPKHVVVARLYQNGVATNGLMASSGAEPYSYRVNSIVRSSVSPDEIVHASEVFTRAPIYFSVLAIVNRGIDIARVGMRAAVKPMRWESIGAAAHSHGGMHIATDGDSAFENSVHTAPETPRVAQNAVGYATGFFPTATAVRNVIAGWVWIDAAGNEHRSGVSLPVSSRTNASPNTSLTLNVSPPPLSADGLARTMILRVWVTGDVSAGAAADAYYLIRESSIFVTVTNGVGWWRVELTSLPVSLVAGEQPYTAGGVLPAEAPPALRDLAAWQDVLVGIDAGDRNLLWYTKPLEPGIAPEWSAALTIRLPSDGGDVVSLNTVDDKLVALKERAIYYVVGTPRDRLGQGTDPIAVRVASDVGCLGRHTTALVPDGLLFVASNGRGLCLLDRGMSLRRMRQAEDRFAEYGPTIHSAVVVPHESCVRWATTGGFVVSLDYEHGAISRFTAYRGGQHQAVIDGRVWLLQAAGTLTREALEGAGDVVADQAPYWSVTTAWIKLAGLNGFQRVRRLVLLSTQPERDKGAVGLTALVAYDYDPTPAGSAAWEPLQWGPGSNGKQVMWHLPRQKCTSIRFTVSENAIGLPPASPVYTSVLLSQLSLRCGVKQSPTKNLAATSRSPSGGGV